MSESLIETESLISDVRHPSDELYRVVYVDSHRVLLRSNTTVRRGGRKHYQCKIRRVFEREVEEGRWEPAEETAEAPSMPKEIEAEEIEWAEVSGVGAKTQEKLYENNIMTDIDLETIPDEEIIEVYGMSEAKLERMKNYSK